MPRSTWVPARARADRLLRPTMVFLAVWAVAAAALVPGRWW
ncbi:MAG TPA: hypothetical protein VFN05_08655 [Actinomycetes bacterium]|nr:hypothetical protein [Actinomycetes bacterium]